MRITDDERKTLKELPTDKLKRAFSFLEAPHEIDLHGWGPIQGTGLKRGCIRCEWLMEIDRREQQERIVTAPFPL